MLQTRTLHDKCIYVHDVCGVDCYYYNQSIVENMIFIEMKSPVSELLWQVLGESA